MSWSRLIRFEALEDSEIHYGEPVQTGDIGLLYHARALLTARVLSASPLTPGAALTAQVLTVKTLLSPLPAAAIRTIRGLGAQYPTLPLAAFKPAPLPILFYKPTSTIASPEDAIFIPASARGKNNDYEVEICVVLGRTAKNVSVADALSYVLGYCSSNDISSRSLCAQGGQWGFGKSYDSWCPIGPVLVSPATLGNPQNLEMKTFVNGQLKQSVNTRDMVYSIAQLISSMSQGVTLEAGSIILSGSPPPLNRAADADPWLKHGDEVHCYVEGCGTLINRVVEEGGVQHKSKL